MCPRRSGSQADPLPGGPTSRITTMTTKSLSKQLVTAGILSLAVTAFFLAGTSRRPVVAQAVPDQGDVWKTAKFDGASYCMTCHTFPSARDEEGGSLDLVLLTE